MRRDWEHPERTALARVRATVVAGEIPLDRARIESLPAFELIACFTSGYDGIDVDWAHAHCWRLSHAPSVNHEDVADHAVGLILAARRLSVEGDRRVRAGEWTAKGRTADAVAARTAGRRRRSGIDWRGGRAPLRRHASARRLVGTAREA